MKPDSLCLYRKTEGNDESLENELPSTDEKSCASARERKWSFASKVLLGRLIPARFWMVQAFKVQYIFICTKIGPKSGRITLKNTSLLSPSKRSHTQISLEARQASWRGKKNSIYFTVNKGKE